jgi:hypothetical protein
MRKKSIEANELDKLFDRKKDIISHLDLSKAERPGLKPKRINISIPSWIFKSIEKEATKYGVTKEVIIKQWIAERIKQAAA